MHSGVNYLLPTVFSAHDPAPPPFNSFQMVAVLNREQFFLECDSLNSCLCKQLIYLPPWLTSFLMCFNDFFNFYAFPSGKVNHKLKTTTRISCILTACQTLFCVSSMLIQRISKSQIPLASSCSKWGNWGRQRVSHAQDHRTRRQRRMAWTLEMWLHGPQGPQYEHLCSPMKDWTWRTNCGRHAEMLSKYER